MTEEEAFAKALEIMENSGLNYSKSTLAVVADTILAAYREGRYRREYRPNGPGWD